MFAAGRGDGSDLTDPADPLFTRAMGCVEAEDIHTGNQQLIQHSFRIGGGSAGGDDFGCS